MKLLILDLNGVLTKETLGFKLAKKYKPEGIKIWQLYAENKMSTAELIKNISATHKGLIVDRVENEAERI